MTLEASSPQHVNAAKVRASLINKARRLRAEIEQIFSDTGYWNANVRKPHEAPIDPDPDGTMRKLADRLDRMLSSDKGVGPIAPILDPGPTRPM